MVSPRALKVEKILSNDLGRIIAVFMRSLEDWMSIPNRSWYRSSRCKANVFFELISRNAEMEFADDPDVRFIKKMGQLSSCFMGLCFCVLKNLISVVSGLIF